MTREDQILLERVDRLAIELVPTPVLRLAEDDVELYTKLEFHNPTGSAKDRTALWMLRQGIERGDITSGTTIVESSSGNLAVSMAAYCRRLGLSFVPVIDPFCTASTEALLRAACVRVEKVDAVDETGGYLAARLARAGELRAELGRAYWPDQYRSADAVAAHYWLTGRELCADLPALDYLFVGVGTGGTIAGVSQRVKEAFPDCRVVAVTGGWRVPGLVPTGASPLCRQALIDEVVEVAESEAAAGCRQLRRRHGVYAGGSSGGVYAAIRRYFAGFPAAGPRPTAAFLAVDRGHPYADTLHNPAWLAAPAPVA